LGKILIQEVSKRFLNIQSQQVKDQVECKEEEGAGRPKRSNKGGQMYLTIQVESQEETRRGIEANRTNDGRHSKKTSRRANDIYKSTWRIKEIPKTTLETKGMHRRSKKLRENVLLIAEDKWRHLKYCSTSEFSLKLHDTIYITMTSAI
jgi:hypothetical protein